MMAPADTEVSSKRSIPMVHDLVLAMVFLGMIIAPALLAMRSGREEKDSL
jgi:hypothetical protein